MRLIKERPPPASFPDSFTAPSQNCLAIHPSVRTQGTTKTTQAVHPATVLNAAHI